MFFPGSREWQAWHFLKTRRPAEASPAVGAAFEAGGGELEVGSGALEAAGEGDCPVVALCDGLLLAAMWS
jgi:hypothetical protein